MFEKIAEEQGWSEATKVLVLLAYIENQGSDEAFIDFVRQYGAFNPFLDTDDDTDEEYEYDHDGQPTEHEEWMSFDPDC